ncbi:MAG TPA: Xaa-Pro peptidase family protein [Gemmatimonadaceae bacterium]|nr:Xaa-Pro peptidase family protein [Gemmatimonadaceae bacterium]
MSAKRLSPGSLGDYQAALKRAGVDGWLFYDFRGTNPIAGELLGVSGFVTRRFFVWLPTEGTPVAVTHAIEQGVWSAWPSAWKKVVYSSWKSLESHVASLVSGKRIAMEYSAGGAVPYLDRIPAGMLELIRTTGATVVTSGDLVSHFYARWSDEDLASHRRAAVIVANIARDAHRFAGEQARNGRPAMEHEVQSRIAAAFDRAGLLYSHPPNVSFGANAANPHYEPSPDHPVAIEAGQTLLIDLWATEPGGVYADQTWMSSLGTPSPRAMSIWEAVRDARDAALSLLREKAVARTPVRGGEADDAARQVIVGRGFGEYFTHRTGHSIDQKDLHGSGPNLDNLETREERLIFPGIGFSVEPGVYIAGEIGMRSEVNCCFLDGSLAITPDEYQRDMMIV